jgi:hypothetical protein
MIYEMFCGAVGFGFAMTRWGKKLENKIRKIEISGEQEIVQFGDGKYAIRGKFLGITMYRNLINTEINDPFVKWCIKSESGFEHRCKVNDRVICEEIMKRNNVNNDETVVGE